MMPFERQILNSSLASSVGCVQGGDGGDGGFGPFTPEAESANGRLAMLGFAAVLLMELASGVKAF